MLPNLLSMHTGYFTVIEKFLIVTLKIAYIITACAMDVATLLTWINDFLIGRIQQVVLNSLDGYIVMVLEGALQSSCC